MSTWSPSAEMTALISQLTRQRRHVLGILDGLDRDALRRPVLPSGWTCLGLVRHLALDVERFWFRGVTAGEQAVIDRLAESGDAWQVDAEMSADAVFDLYREEIRLADAILTAADPGAAPDWWPEDLFGDWRLNTVREIILHVITETACHAGHLDAVRELIDGKRWMVLT